MSYLLYNVYLTSYQYDQDYQIKIREWVRRFLKHRGVCHEETRLINRIQLKGAA